MHEDQLPEDDLLSEDGDRPPKPELIIPTPVKSEHGPSHFATVTPLLKMESDEAPQTSIDSDDNEDPYEDAMRVFLEKEGRKTRKSCSLDRIDVVYKLLIRPCKSYVNALFNSYFSRNNRKNNKIQCYIDLCKKIGLPSKCVPILVLVGIRHLNLCK